MSQQKLWVMIRGHTICVTDGASIAAAVAATGFIVSRKAYH
jgi:hypothetical protein